MRIVKGGMAIEDTERWNTLVVLDLFGSSHPSLLRTRTGFNKWLI